MDAPGRPSRNAAISWAHYAIAATKKREREAFKGAGISTFILVDADIAIGQANPSQQTGLFADLLDADVAKQYSAPLNAFFYSWVFDNLDHPSDKVTWGAAPEHFRELLNKVNTWLDEPQEPDSRQEPVETDDLRGRLDAVLQALEENPWSNVGRDVAELLSVLGVNFDEPSRWEKIHSLKQWLDCLGSGDKVLGARSTSGIRWPRFETDEELNFLRVWRSRLWKVRHEREEPGSSTAKKEQDLPLRTRNIDADARVLAAITLLNRDWRTTKRRVELLTASKYLLRAVSGSALIPSLNPEKPDDAQSGAMAEFIHMPSMILAEERLWEPIKAERETGAESIAEWGMPRIYEFHGDVAQWYVLINGQRPQHGMSGNSPWQASVDDVHATVLKIGQSFRHFFSDKISKSVALAQVRDRLGVTRGEKVALARSELHKYSSKEIRERVAELAEFRRVQLRVDMLEYLIQAHHLKQEWDTDGGKANPLRNPPYVDFGEPDYTRQLRDALVKEPMIPREKILQIKLRLLEHDPSTYKIVLAYASVYSVRCLWSLAASAAEYAYLLSQTSEYIGKRPDVVLGDEAKLLQIACLRRAAHNQEQLDTGVRLLGEYRARIPQQVSKQKPLFRVRLELEDSSLSLTKLLMEFFGSATDRVTHEFRSKVSDALHELFELQTTHATILRPGDFVTADLTLDNIRDKFTANALNLACLAAGWSVAELKRGAMLAPRRDVLARHYTPPVLGFVQAALQMSAASAKSRMAEWQTKPSHELLTTFTARMILAPELLDLHSRETRQALVQALESWRHIKYDHPYDLKRIDYGLELAKRVRF